ncbi:hypothetical protein A2955_00090 [Candidatus Woesebacteria bacterium RIFCSPLOWO2_01_FULL_37_19]|uniref:DUF2029 domain-containing protein n=1 Tax=Candidatus Woesebacteria bacterium RIFCSPLOWO2_01_FULL_37_19 TaxID=1802514 RepID=A0A1F8B2E0_9BACT|nr:MAG: hypothetical protein A2955_00090 [Candidatus Woesebacteria bacterium RIFCSPLOWO2_01_FULL_37_19]
MTLFISVIFISNKDIILGSDFLNHFVAAEIIRRGEGSRIYDIEYNYKVQAEILERNDLRNKNVFRPLPTIAILFLPLTLFPVIDAFKIYTLLNLILLGVLTFLGYKTFGNIKRNKPLFSFVPWLFYPGLITLQMGQTSLILTLILFSVYILMRKKKWLLAGLAAALIVLKTQYIIILPFLLLLSKNKKLFLLGVSLSFLCLLVLNIAVLGVGPFTRYPNFLLATETSIFGSDTGLSYTFYSFLRDSYLTRSLDKFPLIFINFSAYALVFYIFLKQKVNILFEDGFSLAVLVMIFFSLHSLSFDLTMLLIPLFILLNRVAKTDSFKINQDTLFVAVLFFLPWLNYFKNYIYVELILAIVGIYFFSNIRQHSLNPKKPI